MREIHKVTSETRVPEETGHPDIAPNLTTLANRFGSDKGTRVGSKHNYTALYDLVLYELRQRPINLLEIGLAVGGPELGGPIDRRILSPSVQMWLAYFTCAQIFGFDISDFSHMNQDIRFSFVRGDCGSEDDLRGILALCSSFDVIIDDASHASYHQQMAFRTLFPALTKGGLYIIEDLHWQSPAFEDVLPVVPKTWTFFESWFGTSEYMPNSVLSQPFMEEVRKQAFSVSFFRDYTGATRSPKMLILRKHV